MNDINWIDAGYKEGDTFSVYDNEYTIDSSGHINVSSGGWIYIDGNYLSTSYISIMSGSTNDPDGKIARENAEKKAKENREKEEKLKEKRATEKAEKKKAAEKRAAKRAAEKSETYTVTIEGTSVESITEQLIDRAASASAVTFSALSMTGFDAKA